MRKAYFFLVSSLFLVSSFSFAEWEKPEIRLSNAYRYLSREHHGIYIRRGELDFNYRRGQDIFSNIKISPFIELQNNLNKSRRLERKEIGIEIGTDLYSWLYIGESFQYTRYNYDWTNYIWHPHIKYAGEMESRIMLSLPVADIGQEKKVEVYLLDEWTYSFKLEDGTRNEIILGISVPIIEHLEGNLGWRHIDRIHDFDSDAIEMTFTLYF